MGLVWSRTRHRLRQGRQEQCVLSSLSPASQCSYTDTHTDILTHSYRHTCTCARVYTHIYSCILTYILHIYSHILLLTYTHRTYTGFSTYPRALLCSLTHRCAPYHGAPHMFPPHTRHAFSHSTDIHAPWPPALGPAHMCPIFCHAHAGIPIWPCHTPLTTHHTPYSTRHMRGHRLAIPPVLPCPHKSHCTAAVPVILKILLQRLPQRCRLPSPQMSPLRPPQDWAWLWPPEPPNTGSAQC